MIYIRKAYNHTNEYYSIYQMIERDILSVFEPHSSYFRLYAPISTLENYSTHI